MLLLFLAVQVLPAVNAMDEINAKFGMKLKAEAVEKIKGASEAYQVIFPEVWIECFDRARKLCHDHDYDPKDYKTWKKGAIEDMEKTILEDYPHSEDEDDLVSVRKFVELSSVATMYCEMYCEARVKPEEVEPNHDPFTDVCCRMEAILFHIAPELKKRMESPFEESFKHLPTQLTVGVIRIILEYAEIAPSDATESTPMHKKPIMETLRKWKTAKPVARKIVARKKSRATEELDT